MDPIQIAEAVRVACLHVLVDAHEDAGVQGLCAEGRWEYAVGAVRRLDLRAVVDPFTADRPRRER